MKKIQIKLLIQFDKIFQAFKGGVLKIKKFVLRRMMRNYKKGPGFYTNVKYFEHFKKIYVLNQSNQVHLGDGINFALAASVDDSCELVLYRSLFELFKALDVNRIRQSSDNSKKDSIEITTIGRLQDLISLFFKRPIVIFDLMDVNINCRLPIYIANQLGLNKLSLSKFKNNLNEKYKVRNTVTNHAYIILNIEIASGAFRISEVDIFNLLEKAFNYAKSAKVDIILVGIKNIDYREIYNDEFVNLIDMRNKLNIDKLVELISSDLCLSIFSFDNLIMHIGNIFEKECNIKFRGKSRIMEEVFHFNYVNNSYRNDESIIYL